MHHASSSLLFVYVVHLAPGVVVQPVGVAAGLGAGGAGGSGAGVLFVLCVRVPACSASTALHPFPCLLRKGALHALTVQHMGWPLPCSNAGAMEQEALMATAIAPSVGIGSGAGAHTGALEAEHTTAEGAVRSCSHNLDWM